MKYLSSILKNKSYWLWLLVVFVLALGIRIFQLGSFPSTFFVDEILSGYLGRYILQNSVDLYGNAWPFLYFNKFGDYYIILPMYLDGISTLIFGLTRFATRFPTALLGALSIFPAAGIAYLIYRNKTVSILSGLLLAFFPWHIVLSRATTESVIEMFFLIISFFLMYQAISTRKARFLIASFVILISCYLIYHTSRVLVPLIWIGYIIVFLNQLKSKKVLLGSSILFFLLSIGLTLYISTTPWGKGRFSQVSILSEQSGVSIRMTEMTYNLGNNSILLARIFHNKLIGYSREFLNQYLSYFSPLYLFSAQAWLRTRYAVPEMGPAMIAMLVAFVSFFLPSRKELKINRQYLLFLLWILAVSAIPASFTVIESPNIRRSILLVLPLTILAAAGWARSFDIHIKSRLFSVGSLISLLFLGETVLFAYYYFFQADTLSSFYRNDGFPEIASYLLEKDSTYEKAFVFASTDFPLYYLFEKKDLSKKWSEKFKKGFNIAQLDNVYIRSESCSENALTDIAPTIQEQDIFIETASCEVDPCYFKVIDQIAGVNPFYTTYHVLAPADEETKEKLQCKKPML